MPSQPDTCQPLARGAGVVEMDRLDTASPAAYIRVGRERREEESVRGEEGRDGLVRGVRSLTCFFGSRCSSFIKPSTSAALF